MNSGRKMSSPILVTGVAGFIGFHVAKKLLEHGEVVVSVDNLSPYYDVSLKKARLDILKKFPNFTFHEVDVADKPAMEKVWAAYHPKHIIHLAAQAGVRYSLVDPYAYVHSNVMGNLVLLELARQEAGFEHFVYASTSSVYGANDRLPFSVTDPTDQPLSVYAATKKMDELLASAYKYLYSMPMTGLRFFTVYGPWGRPDMSAFIFIRNILSNTPVPIFNHGDMGRDYTYIDDIVDGVIRALKHIPRGENGEALHKIYNLGNKKRESLLTFLDTLELYLGKKAIRDFQPMQKADIQATCADISLTEQELGYAPKISIDTGIKNLVEWYFSYYGNQEQNTDSGKRREIR